MRTLEGDRYVVLLDCGHWVQTRRPDDTSWWCDPDNTNRPAARTMDGQPAVLTSWDLWTGPTTYGDNWRGHG